LGIFGISAADRPIGDQEKDAEKVGNSEEEGGHPSEVVGDDDEDGEDDKEEVKDGEEATDRKLDQV